MRIPRAPIAATITLGMITGPALAAAQDDPRWPNPTEASMFGGLMVGGSKILEDLTTADGLYIGGFEETLWSSVSDPRLEGTITIATSLIDSGLGPTQDTDVLSNTLLIENADGSWVGQPSVWFWLEDDTISSRVHILTGEGAYAGWTALLQAAGDLDGTDGVTVNGVIYQGPVPQPPSFPVSDWQ